MTTAVPIPAIERVRVRRQLLAERCTLESVGRAIRADQRPFVLCGRWAGAAAIAGGEPLLTCDDGATALDALTAPPEPADAAPPELLDAFADEIVGGGWFGFLGFDLARRLERLPAPPPRRGAAAPEVRLGYYDHVLRLDRRGRCWFEALETPERAPALRARAAELAARLADSAALPWSADGLEPLAPGLAGHAEAVAAVIERIAAGEVFQANLCLRLEGRLVGSALDAWLELMHPHRAAYGAYVGWDGGALLSTSPELFLRRQGSRVVSMPMKGTRPRTPGSDAGARELAASAKDAAEHVMIVDLVRNDLGRVCRYGSIAVDGPRIEPHAGVWQQVSSVSGELRGGVTDGDLLRAAFPPGSVTGAPKIHALELIAAEEATARGVHCGAIGYASPLAGLELSVAIRTLELAGERLALGVGGAVVADSSPAGEVAECLTKAAPIATALGLDLPPNAPAGGDDRAPDAVAPLVAPPRTWRPDPAAGLLETIAVEEAAAVAVERHLDRLASSARTLWGLEVDRDEVDRRIAALARDGAPAIRVRLRPGDVVVEPRPRPRPTTRAAELVPALLPGGLGPHKWADRSGLDRADGATVLLCDRANEVLEAAWATVWVREGATVVTPPADGRILPGIARARVLEQPSLVRATHAREERIDLDRLARADAILLTSALRLGVPARLA